MGDKTKHNWSMERGRSMVEILAVLAIMGILRIIGLYLYEIAMSKMKANELLYEVNKRAYTCSGNLLTGSNSTKCGDQFTLTSPTTGDIEYQLITYEDFFGIRTSQIEDSVCKKAIATGNTVPYAIVDECDSDNQITFYYRNDMSECTDPTVCIVPKQCEDETKKCGAGCCQEGEYCRDKECCPAIKYIAADYNNDGAGELCCTGDKVAVAVGDTGKYTCKTPEEGDNCLDGITPNQALCNKDGEEKLYCRVSSISNCVPTAATCKPLPTIIPATIKKAGTLEMGTWKKADEAMDWWSGKDLCAAIGMETPNAESFCGGNCQNNGTPRRVDTALSFGSNGVRLTENSDCNASATVTNAGNYWIENRQKTQLIKPICQPVNYHEPDCPSGSTYSASDDTCGTPCTSYETCKAALGEGYYCRFDTSTATGNNCSSTPTGLCKPLPTITPATLTKAGMTMGIWKKADEAMDWWSGKDLCAAIGMETPNAESFCGGNCQNNGTPRRVDTALSFGSNGVRLTENSDCNASATVTNAGNYWIENRQKTQLIKPICQPVNYHEPDCPTGTYNVNTDACE